MKPVILAILDGWGINASSSKNNAVAQARIPNLEEVEKNYPFCSLQASGIAVGLPWNEAGNSEVGHLIIGSGRIIYQYLPRISMDIRDGNFFKNPAFLQIINHIKKNNSTLHLMGLISSGSVHSYLEHLYGLIELANQNNIEKMNLHLFTDGRDAPLKEGKKILVAIQEKLKNPNWKIATIIGRYFAMDRNQNWDRTEIAYNLLTSGAGEKTNDLIAKINEFYEQEITDPYIKPIVVVDESQEPAGLIKDNDAIIFFNFREDSARQLTEAFVKTNFNEFVRKPISNLLFCAMTEYEKGLPVEIAYPPIEIKNHLTEVLNNAGKRVLKLAETEKYAHVTYFFNTNNEEPYPNEKRILIPSKIVAHYDENPEMQADKVTETAVKELKNYDLIVINYANADMIGHTGNFDAAIRAAEYLDKAVKPLIELAEKGECVLIITSDHGHFEEMINLQTGEIMTEHTTNPVPFYLIGKEFKIKNPSFAKAPEGKPQGLLSDIAPTILDLMQIPQPSEMTGVSLLGVLK